MISCKNVLYILIQYVNRGKCFRCRRSKPVGEQNYVADPALEALKGKGEIQWQEVIDPSSYQVYVISHH